MKVDKKQSSNPRRIPKQKRSIEKHDKILSSAMELMFEKASTNITTHEVAEHVGISVGALYQFFKNIEMVKAAAIEKLLDSLFDDLMDTLAQNNDYNLVTLNDALIDATLLFYENNQKVVDCIVVIWDSEEFVKANKRINERLISTMTDFILSYDNTYNKADVLMMVTVNIMVSDVMTRLMWGAKSKEERVAYENEWKLLARSYCITTLATKGRCVKE